MSQEEKDYLTMIGIKEKQFDAMYRDAAKSFGLSDCSMWALYYLCLSKEPLTQQDLIEKMMFPKQTINSAVMSLSNNGLVELEMIPGTRNKKKIILTEKGMNAIDRSVRRMRDAEEKAVKEMGDRKMQKYTKLYDEFYTAMERNFKNDGII